MTLTDKNFWRFILGLTFFRLLYIYFLPVSPQEAYYWYYAQNPALSYFDHPPMTAYSIWLGTLFFGNTVFGIKIGAVVWSFLTNVFLFKTVQQALGAGDEKASRIAFGAVLLYNVTVFAHLYAMLSVPDTPLLFFWLLSIYFFQKIMLTGKSYYWLLAGLALGLGLVSKYTAVGVLPAFFIVMIIRPEMRRWFKTIWPYAAVLVMLITFFPVIYWNAEHHWASLGFQFTDRAAHVKKWQSKYFGQLFASQFALLTPLVFVVLIRLSLKIKTFWRENQSVLFFFLSGIFLIGGFLLISLRSQVKMNWLLPGYPGLIMAAVLFFYEKTDWRSKWMKTGISFSLFLILIMHLLQIIPNMPLGEGNTWSGWQDASQKIFTQQQKLGGQKKCFIFANSYKSASLLKFYLSDQQDTYAQNIYDRPALQFDIWGKPDSLSGKDALYICTNRHEYKKDLKYIRPFFDSVELLTKFKYRFAKKYDVRTIYCYYAKNYQPADR